MRGTWDIVAACCAAVALAAAPGCPRLTHRAGSAEGRASAPEPAPPGEAGSPPDGGEEARAAEPIGLSDLSAALDIPPRAKAESRAALKRLRAGEHEAAAAGFRKALELAPGYDLARYNLACSLSLDGRHAESARELRTLLHRALPRFARRYESDPDLAGLRDSPEGRELAALVETLGERWQEALRKGLPVAAGTSWETERPGGKVRFHVVAWPGSYLHETRRFVPMTDWLEASEVPIWEYTWQIATLLDPSARTAVALFSKDQPNHGITHARLEAYRAVTGERLVELPIDDEPYEGQIMGLETAPTDGGATYRARAPAGWGPWLSGAKGGPPASAPRGAYLFRSLDEGTLLLSSFPPGFGLRGNELTTPERSIRLGAGHAVAGFHSLLLHATEPVAVVMSLRSPVSGTTRDVARHFIDRVDLRTGAVTRLSEGDGPARILFGADGFLYAERNGPLLRRDVLRPDAEWEPTMEGISLTSGAGYVQFDGI